MDRRAQSVAEIQLFFILTPCPSCGLTALRPRGAAAPSAGETELRLRAACARCLRDYPDEFLIAYPGVIGLRAGIGGGPRVGAIRMAAQPSEMIDVVGWIALYGTIIERSWREADKKAARRLAWEAGLCLDEALKFYPNGERFPPPEAFFTPESQARFRAFRNQFDREIVLDHRQHTPVLTEAERLSLAIDAMDGAWLFWQKHIEPRTGWQHDHG